MFTYFWSILIETPPRLLQSCRLLIRQQLARPPADKIPFLPLPRSLKDYLNYYHWHVDQDEPYMQPRSQTPSLFASLVVKHGANL